MTHVDVALSDSSRFVLWLLDQPDLEYARIDLEAAAARCPDAGPDIDWPVVRAVLGQSGDVTDQHARAGSADESHLDYDNPSVIRQIVKNNPVGDDEARYLFREMLKFLTATNTLIGAHGEYWPKAPPLSIDWAWHEFILHTEDYAEYCERSFGRFLDHHPSPVPDGPQEKVNSAVTYTRVLLEADARYGPLDPEVWPRVRVCPDGGVLSTAQL